MKKKIFFIIIFMGLTSCKVQFKNICSTLKKIDKNDQLYRDLIPIPFFKVLDSIRNSKNITIKQYSKLPRKTQLEYGRIARKIVDKKPTTKKQKKITDSLMAKQIVLDNKNTEQLLKIIKKNGYPNKKNCKEKIFPEIVLRHSQPKYFDEIRSLITKEFETGRINKFDYKFILHHINGREKSKIHLTRE